MKKLVSIALAAVMLVTLAACGGSGGGAPAPAPAQQPAGTSPEAPAASTEEQITLTYWAHMETPWNNDDARVIAAFEDKYPNIKIQYEAFPYDDFESKTQTSLLSKSGGADIYKIWGGWAPDFVEASAFSPVPAELLKDLEDDCYHPVLAGFLLDGACYGVPLEFNIEYGGMLALKPYFEENNIPYPTTWDDMIKIARENSESSGDVFTMRGLDFVSFDTVPFTWLSMILSSGGQFVTNETEYDFDTPIAIETLQLLADYITKDKMTSISGLTGGGDVENLDWLFLGEALMVPRGIWSIPVGVNDYEVGYGTDFDYIPMPFYGLEKKWAAGTGWGLAVNSASANQEAAWKFIEFLMEPESLRETNINCGMIPPRKSVAHDPAIVAEMPYAAPIIDILDGAQFMGYYNQDVLKEYICDALVDMVLNGTSAEDAVKELNSKLKE